jgi:4-hydroxybenzoate polyprenyltransferase
MLAALIKSMRPRQWTKNAFLFAALVFDGKLFHVSDFLRTLAGFGLFCLISSATYIINDLLDVSADRMHPVKKNRPIASGKLPGSVALTVAVVLSLVTLVLGYYLSFQFALTILVYFALMLVYSKWLKHVPILDVLIVSTGFLLRVHAGTNLIIVERFSPWLYVLMALLALYLGFGKRRAELALLLDNPNNQAGSPNFRKVLDGYTIPLLDQFITIVSGTTIVSYSLYTFFRPETPGNHALMLTIPYVIYAIFRYLYLIQVKQVGSEPEEILLSDRPFQLSIFLWGLAVLAVFYLA